MKNIWLVLVAFSLIFVSCKDETSVVSSNLQAKGSVKLSLDKNTTPSNVAQVKVSLTKEGYTPITGIMNIVSDSTASLTLNEIAAGTWHVKVDAYNNQQVVVYSGETDANIVSDQITQLNLTLYSTNSGLGGIAISVTWSNSVLPTTGWTDYPFGSIMTGTLPREQYGVAYPFTLYDNGTYKMYYTAVQSGRLDVCYATSPDGYNWTKTSSPVLSPSATGFDNRLVGSTKLIKVGDTYRMYYMAQSQNGVYSIGLATSTDGVNWTRRSTPVLTKSLSWEISIRPADIVLHNDKYYFYYYSYSPQSTLIGLAISSDGINFTKEPNPIILPTLSWEGNSLATPSVIYDNNRFIMVYHTFPNCDRIGYAESNDGKNWTKQTNPIFKKEMATNNWINKFASVNLLKVNNEYRIYYSATVNPNFGDYYEIGVLNKSNK